GELHAPRIHRIIITDDFNAYAAQRPRFSLVGPTENTLALGLPYMLAVSPDEFRATVAHEFGHFSGKHGKFGATIYRQTVTWHRIWDQLSKSNASWLLSSFLSWYMPKFEALSFAL